jgi:hypothetical protein
VNAGLGSFDRIARSRRPPHSAAPPRVGVQEGPLSRELLLPVVRTLPQLDRALPDRRLEVVFVLGVGTLESQLDQRVGIVGDGGQAPPQQVMDIGRRVDDRADD